MTSMEYSYQPERANWFTRFLWHSAGADSQLLNRCPKSDQVKYECLGGLVLSTSVLAFMSGSYAMYVALSRKDGDFANQLDIMSLVAAIVVGLFWSFVIYNIERFIVSSMGKVDETGAITFSKIWRSIPRIILSLIVGFVLAAPLEVRVLEKEVQQKLNVEQSAKRAEYKDQLKRELSEDNRRRNFRAKLQSNEYAQTKLRILDLTQQIARKRANYSIKTPEQLDNPNLELSNALKAELRIILSTPALRSKFIETTSRDLGDAAKGTGLLGKLQKETNRLESLKKNAKLVAEVDKVDREFESTRQGEYENNIRKLENEGGLIKQLEIIRSDPKLERIAFFLRLLLIIIETSPIFFKMMVSRSTYEVLLDSQQRISSAQQGVLRGGLVTLDGRLVPTSELSIAAVAYEAELRRRSETESRLADEVHRVVRERTAEEIREHPEDYYSRYGTSTSGTRHSPGTGTSPRYTAHTSGPTPSDPYGRRYVDDPSGSGSTEAPSGPDPGMGFVVTGGVATGSSTGSYYVRSREEYERFVATTPTAETVVLGDEVSAESTESRSGESSPFVGTEDSSTTASLSAETYSSKLVTDESTTSGTETLTYAVSDSAVVDSSSTSSDSAVAYETVAPPTVTDDTSDEYLGHEEVVSPAVVNLDDPEGEFTASEFVSDEMGFDSAADVTSAGSIDESVAAEHSDTSVSGPLDGVIWSEGEVPNAELLTTVITEDLPVDDTAAESPDTDGDPRTTRTPDTHEPAK